MYIFEREPLGSLKEDWTIGHTTTTQILYPFALFCLTELKEWWSGCIIFPSNSVLTTDCDELVASSSSFYSVCTPAVQCTMGWNIFWRRIHVLKIIFHQSSYNHKGGLISESFFFNLSKHVKNSYHEHLFYRWIKDDKWNQDSDLALLWEIWTTLKRMPRLSYL